MRWAAAKALASGFMHRKDLPWDDLQYLAWADIGRRIDVVANRALVQVSFVDDLVRPGMKIGQLPGDFGRIKSATRAGVRIEVKDTAGFMAGEGHATIIGGQVLSRIGGIWDLVYGRIPAACLTDNDTNEILASYPNVAVAGLRLQGSIWAQDAELVDGATVQLDNALFEANANDAWSRKQAGDGPNVRGG
jgi:hypothetical protein